MYQTVWRRMGTRLGGRGRIAFLSVGEGGWARRSGWKKRVQYDPHGRRDTAEWPRQARERVGCEERRAACTQRSHMTEKNRAGMHHIPQDDATPPPGLEGGPHGNNVGIGAGMPGKRGVRRAGRVQPGQRSV